MPDPAKVPEPGFHLVVGPGGIVLRSAPIRNAPRGNLQSPYLRPEVVDTLSEPSQELVLDVLGRDGAVLDSMGWPWVDVGFFDGSQPPAPESLQPGRVRSVPVLRVLRIPATQLSMFLLFSQTRVDFLPDTTRVLTRRGLSFYSLVGSIPPPPHPPELARGLMLQAVPGPVPLVRPR